MLHHHSLPGSEQQVRIIPHYYVKRAAHLVQSGCMHLNYCAAVTFSNTRAALLAVSNLEAAPNTPVDAHVERQVELLGRKDCGRDSSDSAGVAGNTAVPP
jgi:hypothetical protein